MMPSCPQTGLIQRALVSLAVQNATVRLLELGDQSSDCCSEAVHPYKTCRSLTASEVLRSNLKTEGDCRRH